MRLGTAAAAQAAARGGSAGDPRSKPKARRDYNKLWKWATYEVLKQKRISILVKNERDMKVYLIFHILFLALFFMIIRVTIPITDLSTAVTGVNKFLNSAVTYTKLNGEGGSLGDVATLDDAVFYSSALVKTLARDTLLGYDGARPEIEQRKLLRVHRLINAIVFSQRRVRPTDCSYQAMKDTYGMCYEDLDSYEITSGKLVLKNGVSVPYNSKMGGFGVELPYREDEAKELISELEEGLYWDIATRQFSVYFSFHNSPGHFTGMVGVDFGISPYGEVGTGVSIKFLRLQPYSKEVNGDVVWWLHVFGLLALISRFGLFMHSIFSQPHIRWKVAKAIGPWSMIELYILAVFIWVAHDWMVFIDDPARYNFSFSSEHYQNLLPLAVEFQNCLFWIAIILLVCTLRTIEFFVGVQNDRLKMFAHIMEETVMLMAPFLIMFALVFGGFVMAFHILFGQDLPFFNTALSSVQTLTLWFVGSGGGQTSTFNSPGGNFFVPAFVVMIMIVLLNISIALVMEAHEEVMAEDFRMRKPYAHRLADWICDKFGIVKWKNDPYRLLDNKAWENSPLLHAAALRILSKKKESSPAASPIMSPPGFGDLEKMPLEDLQRVAMEQGLLHKDLKDKSAEELRLWLRNRGRYVPTAAMGSPISYGTIGEQYRM